MTMLQSKPQSPRQEPAGEIVSAPRPWSKSGWLVALAAALCLYTATSAPDLVWHDAGDYQWRCARLAIDQPGDAVRSHPLFVLAGHVLGRIEIWNYARGATMASVIGTALLAANVWLIVYLLTGRAVAASVGYLACLLAHTIWQQGVQPQTYGCANALLTGMLAAVVVHCRCRRRRWLLLAFGLGGLGVSVHMLTQLGVGVLGAWTLVQVIRRRQSWWVLPAGVGVWLVGAGLFIYILVLEYARTGSLAATLASAVVGRWGPAVFNVAGLGSLAARSGAMLVLNFPTPVLLLAVWGAWKSFRLLRGTPLAAILAACAALYLLFALRYRVPNQNFFFTPFYALSAIYIGLGVATWGLARKRWVQALIIVLLLAEIPTYWAMAEGARKWQINLRGDDKVSDIPYRDFYRYYLLPWQQTQTGPRRFATEVLTSLPPNAVVVAPSTSLWPLVCVRYVEGLRSDVDVVNLSGCPAAEGESLWDEASNPLEHLRQGGRRLFVVSDERGYMPRWVPKLGRTVPYGLVYEVIP
ncbi:MAG: hypothetical protein LLG01_14650 [Planctomycetaceae bacterium]|nr:hypothetical protein [Planctomycetaceae bacterium]